MIQVIDYHISLYIIFVFSNDGIDEMMPDMIV